MLKSIVPIRKAATFDPVSVRSLKIENGTSGARLRSSQTAKAASRPSEPTKSEIVSHEAQPNWFA